MAAHAQGNDPARVLTEFMKALTTDTDAALALITDDAEVRIVPPPPGTTGVWSGKQQLKQWMLMFVSGQHVTQEIVGTPNVDGNNVSATVMVNTDDFRNWGLGPVQHTYEAVVDGGKLKLLVATIVPAERERVAKAANAYFAAHSPAGMPKTGGEQTPFSFSLLAGLALLAIFGGMGVRRYGIAATGTGRSH
jgi:LPXTG-motif cell wall-anchored protein